MSADKEKSSSEQEKNADSLQEQIDELLSGKMKSGGKKSLRNFLAEKMAEDKETEGK